MESHQLATIFDKLDRNGDDVLSKDEVGELLGELFHFTRRTHVNFDHEKIKIYNKTTNGMYLCIVMLNRVCSDFFWGKALHSR